MLDDNGNPIITAPIWKEMNADAANNIQQPSFIMRTVNYVDETLLVNIPDEIDLPIFDSVMIITNDTNVLTTPQTTNTNILLATYNTNVETIYDFCTSNIVKQSEKQNGFFNSGATVGAQITTQTQDGNQITTGRSTNTSGGSY
jgi:virulence-associated protein VagC